MSSRRNMLKLMAGLTILGGAGSVWSSRVLAAQTQKLAADGSCIEPMLSAPTTNVLMPAEWSHQSATWMAYGATPHAWGEEQETSFGRDLSNSRFVARQDLMRLAANLSRFQAVYMLVDTAADEAEARGFMAEITAQSSAKNQFGRQLDNSGRIYIGKVRKPADLPAINTFPITFLQTHINDLWTRDTAPVFVKDAEGKLYGVDTNFNGWGQWPISTGLCNWAKDAQKTSNGVMDQPVDGDKHIASFILKNKGIAGVPTWLTMEGGGLEVNGAGLAVAMESCIINDNRNPGKDKAQIEAELARVFGVEKVLWMPGVKGEELTDWHVDFTAKFASQTQMVFAFDRNFEPQDNRNEIALNTAVAQVNALPEALRAKYLGRADAKLTLHPLPLPRSKKIYESFKARNAQLPITERSLEEFIETTAPGYVGYTHGNGCIIMGQFGDAERDLIAFNTLQALYPDHVVIQISTDGLASGGGTIHCATQQQPSIS
ncbi:agmatine deiminase family protein [Pseudomonas azerbaijanoccidentalis]